MKMVHIEIQLPTARTTTTIVYRRELNIWYTSQCNVHCIYINTHIKSSVSKLSVSNTMPNSMPNIGRYIYTYINYKV